jgi:tetratricopeptide (TPR) repeat protein
VPAGDEVAARTRLFEAIARLGQALAQRSPVVLFVDDVQWADASSLDVLRYTGRRWAEVGAPVLLLLSLRSEALADSPALEEWLVGLRRDLVVTELDLQLLTDHDMLQLVRGFGGGPRGSTPGYPVEPDLERVASWLFAETGGQPFFAVEIIRELVDRGVLIMRAGALELAPRAAMADPAALGTILPPGVREVIRTRLARLTAAARAFLAAAAVIGEGFTFDQVCEVACLSEDEALPVSDAVVRAHLLRHVDPHRAGSLGTYAFVHDKIRDVVYAEAGEVRVRVFHRRAVHALQATAPAAQLARHAVAAGLDDQAVRFSVAAGDEAMRLLAARDALAHYKRALTIAERSNWTVLLGDLHARCGKAYATMALWSEARREMEAALAGLDQGQRERRAEVLVDLLEVCWWLLDVSSLRQWAQEGRALAEGLGRGDLETLARGWLAAAHGADGDVSACVAESERALARGHELRIPPPAPVYTYLSLSLYWLGRLDEAVQRGGEGVGAARAANHTTATMFSLPHLGLALAGNGRYGEAMEVFQEARRFGHEYGVGTLLARAIAISAGLHLDVWDFEGNEALAGEARDLARSLNFAPPAVSAGIDLLLNFARRQDVGRAEALIGEVAASVDKASGWHGWLWSLRLSEARAEIALARGNWQEALAWAGDTIERSRARERVKYEVIGLTTRAQALRALGRTEKAIAELKVAVAKARPVGDPALFLRPATELLSVDGDDVLAAEAGAAVQQISAALPDVDMRRRFASADPVRMVVGFTARHSH